MSTKLTYTGAEVQELLDKIEKGDFDNAKTLEGHPASYFAIASEFTSLAESFATEQGRVDTLCGYFNNGSANDALSLGGQLPSYYATALQYEILQQTLTDFKSLFDSMFEKDSDGNIHAKLSLWSSGGITAGGVGSVGSGGGGISYNRLDSWSDYSADKSGWVLSALLGKDLDNRVSALTNTGYITASYLAPYALRSEIPSLDGYFLASNFNQANLKSTLGISDWALASVKPTYTASEVGALAVSEELNSGSLNDYTTAGIYRFNVIGDAIAGMTHYGNLLVVRGGNYDTLAQLYFNYNDGKAFIRSSNFQLLPYANWNQIAFTSDIPTKLSQLTNDKINNRLTIESLGDYTGLHIANDKELCGIRFSNSNTSDSGNLIYLGGTDYRVTNDGWTAAYKLLHEGNYSNLLAGGTVNGSITATSFIGNLTGNADSATKLATPRTIWGQSFDGTQDITGDLIGDIWRIIKDPAHNGTFIQSKNYAETSYLGNIFITGWDGNSLSSFNVWANKSIFSGNVAIGGTTAYEKLHIYGNTLISGENNPYLAIEDALNRQWYFQYYDNHISIGTSYSNGVKIDSAGNLLTAGSLTSQAIASAGISIGCDASGVAPDNYAREINTFANKLYLQYRGGDLDLCGGGGTTYIGGALDGKTANFTSLTSPAITTNTLTIGGATITYDSVNEALCINGNMYALGGITAGGAGISAYTSLEARVARLEQQLNI